MTPLSFPLVFSSFGRGLNGFRHRISPELQSTGIAELDAVLRGGFPRGSLIEVCGASSSGRTSLGFSLLAQATARQEACAFVDVSDSLDPMSLAAAGVDLTRVLWIRCGGDFDAKHPSKKTSLPAKIEKSAPHAMTREKNRHGMQGWTHPRNQIRGIESAIPFVMGNADKNKEFSPKKGKEPVVSVSLTSTPQLGEPPGFWQQRNEDSFLRKSSGRNNPWKNLEQALKVTDLLLHAGGWGVVVFDLGSISWVDARRIEMSTWFRFRRAIESTSTILLLLGEDSCAKSCSSLVLRCERKVENWSCISAQSRHSGLTTFQGFEMNGQVVSSRVGLPLMDSAQWSAETVWSNSF
jgi:recombination protein RecA